MGKPFNYFIVSSSLSQRTNYCGEDKARLTDNTLEKTSTKRGCYAVWGLGQRMSLYQQIIIFIVRSEVSDGVRGSGGVMM